MEHELKFQEFIGFGREEDISHLKMAYETVGKKMERRDKFEKLSKRWFGVIDHKYQVKQKKK